MTTRQVPYLFDGNGQCRTIPLVAKREVREDTTPLG